MRAHWPYLQAYLVRGATCWLAARAVAAIVALFASLPALPATTIAAFEAVGVSVALGIVDTLRRRETALIGNLAIHPAVLIGALAVPAALGEWVLHAIGSAVR
jgi:hypothetical protein